MRDYSDEQLDTICKKFIENPAINPETGKRLVYGKGPYLYYSDLCQQYKNKSSKSLYLDDIAIQNIILNSNPLDFISLYLSYSNSRIFDNTFTLELLYDKYIDKNFLQQIEEDFIYNKERFREYYNGDKELAIETLRKKKDEQIALYLKLTREKTLRNFLDAYNLLLSYGSDMKINIVDLYDAIKNEGIISNINTVIQIIGVIESFLLFLSKLFVKFNSFPRALKLILKKDFSDNDHYILSFRDIIEPLNLIDIDQIDLIANGILKDIINCKDDLGEIIDNIFDKYYGGGIKEQMIANMISYINNPYRVFNK